MLGHNQEVATATEGRKGNDGEEERQEEVVSRARTMKPGPSRLERNLL